VLSPNFEFLASEAEGEENEGILGKVLVYWGISAVKATNKDIKKIVQKRAFTYKNWHEMLTSALHEVSYFKYALQQGQTPPPSLDDQYGYSTSIRTLTGATPLLPSMNNMDTVLQYTLQQGKPPSFPQYTT